MTTSEPFDEAWNLLKSDLGFEIIESGEKVEKILPALPALGAGAVKALPFILAAYGGYQGGKNLGLFDDRGMRATDPFLGVYEKPVEGPGGAALAFGTGMTQGIGLGGGLKAGGAVAGKFGAKEAAKEAMQQRLRQEAAELAAKQAQERAAQQMARKNVLDIPYSNLQSPATTYSYASQITPNQLYQMSMESAMKTPSVRAAGLRAGRGQSRALGARDASLRSALASSNPIGRAGTAVSNRLSRKQFANLAKLGLLGSGASALGVASAPLIESAFNYLFGDRGDDQTGAGAGAGAEDFLPFGGYGEGEAGYGQGGGYGEGEDQDKFSDIIYDETLAQQGAETDFVNRKEYGA